jgi:heat shock protein HslJ
MRAARRHRRMAMLRLTTAAVLLALIVAGCTTGANPSPSDRPDPGTIDGRAFLSSDITQDGEPFPLVDGTQVRLAFGDGQITANAGCNTIGGTYRVENGRLLFEGGSMTEMGCDPSLHDQDEWVSEFLGSNPELDLAGDDLTLTSGGVVMTLADREVADPDLPLTGTTWTVTSIFTGDAVSSIPEGATATFAFADDGTVSVHTGCNTGGGRYELSGSTLRFVDVAVTEMACDGPGRDLEAIVLPLIGAGEIQIAIDAGSLTMMADDAGLGLTGS